MFALVERILESREPLRCSLSTHACRWYVHSYAALSVGPSPQRKLFRLGHRHLASQCGSSMYGSITHYALRIVVMRGQPCRTAGQDNRTSQYQIPTVPVPHPQKKEIGCGIFDDSRVSDVDANANAKRHASREPHYASPLQTPTTTPSLHHHSHL